MCSVGVIELLLFLSSGGGGGYEDVGSVCHVSHIDDQVCVCAGNQSLGSL